MHILNKSLNLQNIVIVYDCAQTECTLIGDKWFDFLIETSFGRFQWKNAKYYYTHEIAYTH